MTAAQNSRSQAAPVAPIWSTSPTDTASPSWTQSIDTVAMEAPMRADDLDMTPSQRRQNVRVHVTFLDIPFTRTKQ